jgi:mono/diheme cytochrome c family protein
MMVPVWRSAIVLWLGLLANGSSAQNPPGESARPLFNLNCAPCHGKDGTAKTPMARKLGVKDLTLSKIPDAEIERQIREGKKGPDGNSQMPSFKDKISKDQMKLLITYVKELRKQ